MIIGRAAATIDLPIDQVFRFVAFDFEKNYQRWAPEVKRLQLLTEGPLRVGSRARQVRVDQGRRSDTCFQVTALDPPTKVCFVELSQKFQGEYRMTTQDGRTTLCFEFRLQKVELYMKPFEKLIRLAIQDGSERTVRNIKRLVEHEANERARGLS